MVPCVVQPVMVQAVERYMKQAIVDRNHAVASAALMSSFVSHAWSVQLAGVSVQLVSVLSSLSPLFLLPSLLSPSLPLSPSLSFLPSFSLFLPFSPPFSPLPQHMCGKGSHEIVKRWVNEIQEALSSDSLMVQYHAMGLLYYLRHKDRLAVSKMVTKQIRSSLRSPHGYCLLVRIACKILENEERSSSNMLYDFLETCLRHKSEVREGGVWLVGVSEKGYG